MTINPVLLAPVTQITGSATAMVTSPARVTSWIKSAVLTNTDTAQHTVTLYRVPSGGSAGATNLLLGAYPLSPAGMPGATYPVAELANMILNPGDTIQAFADTAAKVNFTASGFQF